MADAPATPRDGKLCSSPVTPGETAGSCGLQVGCRVTTYAGYLLPSRAAVLDAPACMNGGGRYFVDVIFDKQPDSTPSSHILVDSVGKPRRPASGGGS